MNKILSLAAVALIMASCSESEKEDIRIDASTNETPIVVGSKVEGLSTKAGGVTYNARVLMCDGSSATWENWTEKKENTLNASQGFDNATDRANSSVASFEAGGALSFNPDLYYDSKGSAESYLAAVAPAGEVKDKTVLIATQDGLQDVMYVTATTVGTKAAHTGSPYTLDFKHKTAQLKFAIQKVAASSNGAWTNKTVALKSITIQNAGLPTAVDFTNGTLTYAPSNLAIPGISSPAISTTAANVGQPVMVQHGEVVLNVDITVDGAIKSYNNVKVLNSSANAPLATVAGSAHTITLKVQEPTEIASSESALEVSATISDWTLGEAGSAELK